MEKSLFYFSLFVSAFFGCFLVFLSMPCRPAAISRPFLLKSTNFQFSLHAWARIYDAGCLTTGRICSSTPTASRAAISDLFAVVHTRGWAQKATRWPAWRGQRSSSDVCAVLRVRTNGSPLESRNSLGKPKTTARRSIGIAKQHLSAQRASRLLFSTLAVLAGLRLLVTLVGRNSGLRPSAGPGPFWAGLAWLRLLR